MKFIALIWGRIRNTGQFRSNHEIIRHDGQIPRFRHIWQKSYHLTIHELRKYCLSIGHLTISIRISEVRVFSTFYHWNLGIKIVIFTKFSGNVTKNRFQYSTLTPLFSLYVVDIAYTSKMHRFKTSTDYHHNIDEVGNHSLWSCSHWIDCLPHPYVPPNVCECVWNVCLYYETQFDVEREEIRTLRAVDCEQVFVLTVRIWRTDTCDCLR